MFDQFNDQLGNKFFTVQEKGRLVKSGSYTHSYPFCWRSDTPLIYRAVPSWYAFSDFVFVSGLVSFLMI